MAVYDFASTKEALNNVTVEDVYLLSLVDDCVATVAGSQWFLEQYFVGYWQVELR